jgi:hypothetical protein
MKEVSRDEDSRICGSLSSSEFPKRDSEAAAHVVKERRIHQLLPTNRDLSDWRKLKAVSAYYEYTAN